MQGIKAFKGSQVSPAWSKTNTCVLKSFPRHKERGMHACLKNPHIAQSSPNILASRLPPPWSPFPSLGFDRNHGQLKSTLAGWRINSTDYWLPIWFLWYNYTMQHGLLEAVADKRKHRGGICLSWFTILTADCNHCRFRLVGIICFFKETKRSWQIEL